MIPKMFSPRMNCAFLVLRLTFFVYIEATDYCDPSLCESDEEHIGCNPDNNNFAPSCRNASMINLTEDHKNLIGNAHNTKRNSVAGGETELEPACRMATMEWDDELASLAALNVKQCEMKHDECHNTDAFKYSGQNLAMGSFSRSPGIDHLLQMFVDMWYDEIEHTEMAYIDQYPRNYSGPAIGHFTVMMADRNIRVGCAASSFDSHAMDSVLFACNYATANIIGFPIYKSCEHPASECESGTNPLFNNLCSTSEEYDVNLWF